MLKIYKIPAQNLKYVKAILESPDRKDPKTGKWIANEWALRGYKLVEARSLNLESTDSYLQIDAGEDFFKRNEKQILDAGAISLSGAEFENLKERFKKSEETAQEGFGAIFG
ncbi:MAG: hypothetical protein QW625_01820 [Candidatus Nanoarchaeia archaeon]